jgi:hypothetical protein
MGEALHGLLAAEAFRAIEEPMPSETNKIGATRIPASPPRAELYIK